MTTGTLAPPGVPTAPPEPPLTLRHDIPVQRSLVWAALEARPLRATALLALLGALALQLWRPCFFLTDDTLSGWLPVAVEAYRRMWEGRSPLINDYLFGGNFHLLLDPGTFSLWSPWSLLASILAKTRWYYLLADVVGTLDLVTIAGAFCWAGLRLKQHLGLPISRGVLVLASLSYAFTPFNFIVGASWIGFLNAPAAFPVIFAALFETSFRRGILLVTGALLYALMGGHTHPFMALLVFSSLLVVGVSMVQRHARPMAIWAVGGVLALGCILPLLWPALQGFGESGRSGGLTLARASASKLEMGSLWSSFLFGPGSFAFLKGIRIDLSDPVYNLAIAFSLTNIPLVYLLLSRRRWTALEGLAAGGALVAAVCIVRPVWLGEILLRLPLLRSLRWPFREVSVLLFFTHLLFLLRYRGWPQRLPGLLLGAITGGTFALTFLCVAPTFWLFEVDRRLIMSGAADRFWSEVKAAHEPGPLHIVPAVPPRVMMAARPEVPFTLLGGYNHASLFRVVSPGGYSPTPPPTGRWVGDMGVVPYFWGGVFDDAAADAIANRHPAYHRLSLRGLSPTVVALAEGAGERRYEFPGAVKDDMVPAP